MNISFHPSCRLAFLASIVLVTPTFAALNIDYVPVGNAGNGADSTGYGAVAYSYQIAKNETTIGDYVQFLNAVAKDDPHHLYHAGMTSDLNTAGISRSGSIGSYIYAAIGNVSHPVTYVSWFEAARYVNWLHNGQPIGAQSALTTEDGAYTLNGAENGVNFSRNVGATVWIPSENEWYKAAYYDPQKNGGEGGYWQYANQSNSMTSNSVGVAGAANYYDGDYAVTQGPGYSFNSNQNYLTDVGAYGPNSESYYGTNDQGGNVWELNDAVIGLSRGLRGGSWFDGGGAANQLSSYRGSSNPSEGDGVIGFRVASVPEPTSIGLAILSTALLSRRKR